ncbi:hypothetical protein TeGR_g4134 [Tetraparma gracilis]|uniref:Uncharacterized protein n=1 Tax=Tetraparma gracilis TaxID=2962635 RepID=A0ABQ6N3B6_9STRA|nr:hypothetical protein TeGR_g4134 [Tetraparma gracilis]
MGRSQLQYRKAPGGRGRGGAAGRGEPSQKPTSSKSSSRRQPSLSSIADQSTKYSSKEPLYESDAFESTAASSLASGVATVSLRSEAQLSVLPAGETSEVELGALERKLSGLPLGALVGFQGEEWAFCLTAGGDAKAAVAEVARAREEEAPHADEGADEGEDEDLESWLDDQL